MRLIGFQMTRVKKFRIHLNVSSLELQSLSLPVQVLSLLLSSFYTGCFIDKIMRSTVAVANDLTP